MMVRFGISNVITEQCDNKSDCSIMWCLLLLESQNNHDRYPVPYYRSTLNLQQSTNKVRVVGTYPALAVQQPLLKYIFSSAS